MCTHTLLWEILPHSQILKDWHLLATTMAVTGTTVFLLLLETSIPQLKGIVTQEVDQENPLGTTVNQEILMLIIIISLQPLYSISCILHAAPWNQAAVFCTSLLQSIFSKLLLANFHLCLPCCAPNYWNYSLIPNKKSENPRLK